MLSQVIRASRRATSCQSAQLYQHLTRRAVSTSTTPEAEQPNSDEFDNHVAFIRTWGPLRNIADAYTMMNAMERKYGKIVSARFPKDFEEPTKFQLYSFLYFEEPIAHRIPREGLDFTIPSSGIKKEQHEVSIADLENIFNQNREYNPEYEFPTLNLETEEDRSKTIGGRIRRGGPELIADKNHSLFQNTPRNVMQNFFRWGGFHELKPLEKRSTIQGSDLFPGRVDIDNVRMRAALQQTAMILEQPNPNFAELKRQPSTKTSKDDASTSTPSLGSLAFGGLQEEAASKRKRAASPNLAEKLSQASTKAGESTPASKSSLTSPPPSTTSSSTKTQGSEPLQTPPTRRAPVQTAEQLAAKEALNKQLEFAKQLKQTLAIPYTGRKQAKPSLKQPKQPKSQQQQQEKELDFDHPDYIPRGIPEPEVEKPGVLRRLWNRFGSFR